MHNKKRPSYSYASDQNFLRAVLNSATAHYGKALQQDEVDGLLQHVQSHVDYDQFRNDSRATIIEKVAKSFVLRLRRHDGKTIDVHEMLKRQIGTIPFDPRTSVLEDVEETPFNAAYSNSAYSKSAQKHGRNRNHKEGFADEEKIYAIQAAKDDNSAWKPPPTPKVLLDDATSLFSPAHDKYPRIAKQPQQDLHLMLDSKNRDLSTDWSTFRWGVMNGNSVTQGTVNTLADQVHNIIMMQFDKFFIPYVPTADNGYRRVSLFIREFANTGYMLYNKNSFHILFESENVLNKIDLKPQHNDRGRLRFYTPINVLDSITIQFYNPDQQVIFKPDRYNVVITALSPIASLLTFSENHEVTDGERVDISGFTTLAPAADAILIDQVNDKYGQVVTYLSNTTLSIPVNLTTATIDPSWVSKVFICSRRIFMPVRMTYLV